MDVDVRGTPVTIRTMTPADREIEAEFVRGLSPHSRYLRFHSRMRELTPELLERLTNPSYPDEFALVATVTEAGVERQIGVVRYARTQEDDTAEFAIVVADAFQGAGLGTRLLLELRNIAVANGFAKFEMRVVPENGRMLKLAHKLGFRPQASDDYATRSLGKRVDGPSTKAPN
jgi:acetyltransferase